MTVVCTPLASAGYIYTYMALRWRDKRLVFDSWQRGAPSFFTPVWHYLPPPLGRWARVFARECVRRVYIKGSQPCFFGTRQMRPVTMEGESRLPAASTTTTGISTLSTNDLVFHTVCSVSLDHCYLSREWILHFSTWEPKISLLVTSVMSLKSWWCQRPTTGLSFYINYCVHFRQNQK